MLKDGSHVGLQTRGRGMQTTDVRMQTRDMGGMLTGAMKSRQDVRMQTRGTGVADQAT